MRQLKDLDKWVHWKEATESTHQDDKDFAEDIGFMLKQLNRAHGVITALCSDKLSVKDFTEARKYLYDYKLIENMTDEDWANRDIDLMLEMDTSIMHKGEQ